MFKIVNEFGTISDFEAWSGGIYTQEKIWEAGKEEEFDNLIQELYPDGIDETELNDLLWFEDDWIFKTLGISDEEENDEEF